MKIVVLGAGDVVPHSQRARTGLARRHRRAPDPRAICDGGLPRRPTQTAAAFADGYFKTGDFATLRNGGYVQLVGRSKDVISRGGNKITPLEIEHLFVHHEGVLATLAFGEPDDRLGERLHLMVVAHDRGLSEADLREWAKNWLERFKSPDVFHFVETLPAGRTGKADQAAARMALKRPAS